MKKFSFPRIETGLFKDRQIVMSHDQEQLEPFMGRTFSVDHFKTQMIEKGKVFSSEQRQILVDVLISQYSGIEISDKVKANIDLLSQSSTFTITTGHQLSIFTGPLFFIYKILHVIRLTEELKNQFPDHNFVPVFWMASEDHDLEEIRKVTIFNKALIWDTRQEGPVGKMEFENFEQLKNEVAEFFGEDKQAEILAFLQRYEGVNLASATRNLVDHLFGEAYGLVILDPDSHELKKQAIPLFEKELKEQFSFEAVEAKSELLLKAGHKIQVTAREINLFYIEKGLRSRIIPQANKFFIEGKGEFDQPTLLKMLKDHPEHFSPNVILRPVYQEIILPNLCYIGGVGELAYWLQLKGVFDRTGILYPLIFPRISMLIIDKSTSAKMAKNELVANDLFRNPSDIKKDLLTKFADDELDFSDVDQAFLHLKDTLITKTSGIDANVEKFSLAEMAKLEKQLGTIEEKIIRSMKQKHDHALSQVDQIFDKLFPNGGLQERSMNLITLASDGKIKEKIAQLHDHIDPFDPNFIILEQEK